MKSITMPGTHAPVFQRTAVVTGLLLLAALLYAPLSVGKELSPATVTIEQAVAVYEKGEYEKAYPLLARLGRNGNVDAQYLLSKMYAEGKGVKPDEAKSLANLRRAASIDYARDPGKFGNADAQYDLAQRYAIGKGVQKNPTNAVKYLTRASESAHRKALAELPAYFAGDKGVKKNPSRGYLWAGIAANTLDGAERENANALKEKFGSDFSARQKKQLDLQISKWERRRD
jgi:TPR repeat protein